MSSNKLERPPIFLLCTERCGSNLIRALANSHSGIYAPHGHQALLTLAIFQRQIQLPWDHILDLVLQISSPELRDLKLTKRELQENVPEQTFAGLWTYIHLKGMRLCGKHQLLVKQNRAWKYFPEISTWFPEAKFLHKVRDPRAYVNSCKNVHQLIVHYGSVAGALQVYEEDQNQALTLLQSIPEDRQRSQTYEELVNRPQATLERLCRFADLPFEPQMLEFYKTDSERRLASRYPSMWGNLAKPLTADNVSKYRQSLSWWEIGAIEHKLGPLMDRLGYPPNSTRDSLPERLLWRAYYLWDYLRSRAMNRLAPLLAKHTQRRVGRRKPR